MVGGLSGTALNGQTKFSPAPRNVAAPVAVMVKRYSSAPAGGRPSSLAGTRPPVVDNSSLSLPVARTTNVELTGTLIGPLLPNAAAAVSPGWMPGRMIGGRAV